MVLYRTVLVRVLIILPYRTLGYVLPARAYKIPHTTLLDAAAEMLFINTLMYAAVI